MQGLHYTPEQGWQPAVLALPPSSRAFAYGDSLFETLVARDGRVWELPAHARRLAEGMQALGYAPAGERWLEEGLGKVLEMSGLDKGFARLKCQVWRREGGRYTPLRHDWEAWATAEPWAPDAPKGLSAGVAARPWVQAAWPLSRFKTGSALRYVMAGLERQANGWDEIVLLNERGQVAECGASNVFWVSGGAVHTPSLDTGALAGVARQWLMARLSAAGWPVREAAAPLAEMQAAAHIFATNVAGIHHICRLGTLHYQPWPPLALLWEKRWQDAPPTTT